MAKDDKKSENDDQKKLTEDPAFKKLTEAVQGIALLVQQGQQQGTALQENFKKLMEKVGETAKSKKEKEPDPDDINDLDNVGLIKLVVGEVSKVVDEKLDQVGKTIQSTNQDINDTKLKAEVKEILIDSPDLMDWKKEMRELAEDNPNLSLARLHKLARIEAPEKAKELDDKYKEESDEGKDKETGFLSLMPTGGVGFLDPDSDEKPMTSTEAGDKAWEETLEKFPQLASTGDE